MWLVDSRACVQNTRMPSPLKQEGFICHSFHWCWCNDQVCRWWMAWPFLPLCNQVLLIQIPMLNLWMSWMLTQSSIQHRAISWYPREDLFSTWIIHLNTCHPRYELELSNRNKAQQVFQVLDMWYVMCTKNWPEQNFSVKYFKERHPTLILKYNKVPKAKHDDG